MASELALHCHPTIALPEQRFVQDGPRVDRMYSLDHTLKTMETGRLGSC